MKLSARLQAVFTMVPQGCRLADVGADRGELSYALLGKNRVEHIILTDISPYSLQRAKDLFAASPFLANTEFRVGSGFTVLTPQEVDCAVLAGMGGDTIVSILREAAPITADLATIIVQAMGKSHQVRRYFMENHFRIIEEAMVCEYGHFYTIIKAEPGEMTLSAKELYGGKHLIAAKHPLLKESLGREKKELANILAALRQQGQGEKRQQELKERIAFIEEIEEDLV